MSEIIGGTELSEGLLRNLPPIDIELPRSDERGWYIAKMVRLHPSICDLFLNDRLGNMSEEQKKSFISLIRQKLNIRPPRGTNEENT